MKKNYTLIVLIAFGFGYIMNDLIPNIENKIIPTAHAEVSGMDYHDLKYDYDFKKAVESIIEDCEYTGGYVDGEYIYGGDLDC